MGKFTSFYFTDSKTSKISSIIAKNENTAAMFYFSTAGN